MQITPQILCIPPYLSTSWDNIATLRAEQFASDFTLFATLKNGEIAKVPNLSEADVKTILESHGQFTKTNHPMKFPSPFTFSFPMKSDSSPLGNSMRHNSTQADLPEIPPEVLTRILNVAKAFGVDDFSLLEEPESGCNCMYCQLARNVTPSVKEEKISDEDLQFREWEVKEISDTLYVVTNPIDSSEQYNVFLGEPLGCTCGQKNCEHIKAVLNS